MYHIDMIEHIVHMGDCETLEQAKSEAIAASTHGSTFMVCAAEYDFVYGIAFCGKWYDGDEEEPHG